jgi:hypothetical protein
MGIEEEVEAARRARQLAAEASESARQHAAAVKTEVLAAARDELRIAARVCAEEGFKNRVPFCVSHRPPPLFGTQAKRLRRRPGPMSQAAWYFGHHGHALLMDNGELIPAHAVQATDAIGTLCSCVAPPSIDGLPLLSGDDVRAALAGDVPAAGLYFDPERATLDLRYAGYGADNDARWLSREFGEWLQSGVRALLAGVTWGAAERWPQ